MKKSMEITDMRLLCNLMIVLWHAWAANQYCQLMKDGIEFAIWEKICCSAVNLAMPVFFFFSGYLLMQGFRFENYFEKIKRRVKRLCVPYVLWNLIFVVSYLAMSSVVPRIQRRVDSFEITTLSGILTKTLGFLTPPINMPLWFIRTIFIYAVISPLFLLLWKKGRGVLLWIVSFLWILFLLVSGLDADWVNSYSALSFCMFVLGVHFSLQRVDPIGFFRGRIWLIIGFSAFVLRTFVSWNDLLPWGIGDFILSSMSLSLMINLSVPFAKIVENVGAWACLRDSSFFIYCGHFLFCSSILHVLAPRLSTMGGGKLTVLILVFVICGIILMVCVHKVMQKFFPRMIKLFDGSL